MVHTIHISRAGRVLLHALCFHDSAFILDGLSFDASFRQVSKLLLDTCQFTLGLLSIDPSVQVKATKERMRQRERERERKKGEPRQASTRSKTRSESVRHPASPASESTSTATWPESTMRTSRLRREASCLAAARKEAAPAHDALAITREEAVVSTRMTICLPNHVRCA